MSIGYEWLVEEIDDVGDIVDIHHFDTCAEARAFMAKYPATAGHHYDYGVVRHHEDYSGWADDSYAYVDDNALPEKFHDESNGLTVKVPARFHKELRS